MIEICLEKNGIPFRKELPERLTIYLALLKEWNSRIDLTAVLDDRETIDRHFIDSLSVLKTGLFADGKSSLIDVGTGAGFPGMVLAMACPEMDITLLDAQQKRLRFLQTVSEAAGIRNVSIIHARAEDAARKPELREKFDYATVRAVAPLNTLCEYVMPFVKVGGFALCWKGPALKAEFDNGARAAKILGGLAETPIRCAVEGRDWDHLILPVHKIKHTDPAYPRKAGTPKSKPLGL